MTHLTDSTQDFWTPQFQPEGPESACIIDGQYLGWTQCTPLSMAMALDATTGGRYRISGCSLRRTTGDTHGGTTLRQCADAVLSRSGIYVATYTGPNVISPERLAAYLRAGRKVVFQGGSGAMIGTPFQSTENDVPHAVEGNSVWGGTSVGHPAFANVFDPAANGRNRGYHVDQAPSSWPWSMVLKFCSWLRPNGPGTPRIGPGKVYAAIFPDSEPHVHVVSGGRKSSPFPDRTRANKSRVGIYGGPNGKNRRYSVGRDTLLTGYQYIEGASAWGSTRWMGNDDGTEWVPVGALRQVGGGT